MNASSDERGAENDSLNGSKKFSAPRILAFISVIAVMGIAGTKWLLNSKKESATKNNPQARVEETAPETFQTPKIETALEPTAPAVTEVLPEPAVAPEKISPARPKTVAKKYNGIRNTRKKISQVRVRALPARFSLDDPRFLEMQQLVEQIEAEFEAQPPVVFAELALQISPAMYAQEKNQDQDDATPVEEEEKSEEPEADDNQASNNAITEPLSLPAEEPALQEAVKDIQSIQNHEPQAVARGIRFDAGRGWKDHHR